MKSGSIQSCREAIYRDLQQCRRGTFELFSGVDGDTFCRQAHPDFSPVGWHLGHIAYTEDLWLLQRCAGSKPIFPKYHKLFAADILPKQERVNLPTIAEVECYLDAVRKQVLDYLEIAPIDRQERLWRFIIQHESQHCETVAFVLQMQDREQGTGNREQGTGKKEEGTGNREQGTGNREESSLITDSPFPITNYQLPITDSPLPMPNAQCPMPNAQCPITNSLEIEIPAGEFDMGSDAVGALDNERSRHSSYLETYSIDRYPVTCGQYRNFMSAGGYQNPDWWSQEGWKWLQSHPVVRPLYWLENPAFDSRPVCGVSWYEAEAYCNFAGQRLPTESEWEKAASWDAETQTKRTYPWGEELPNSMLCNHGNRIGNTSPVDAFPQGASATGCCDMLGNVWEWTASWFAAYPGFESYPYTGYSQVYFDGQHRVLKGGSWATPAWTLRSSFRNWYDPGVRQILAGFRCAR
ncbi:MAG: ergothioneine biosynthesis protein EgtB [Oscillatoriaceae cyanobacterium Prado104]|nr:ergothioneine biosynthesis protein EgtB [Oscillatoriaceae cyanobacterium Prado104]